jgi:hypothetical protein
MKKSGLKQFFFYWLASFVIGFVLYNILKILKIGFQTDQPFNMWLWRDYLNDYPSFYIGLVCLFFGIFASIFAKRFAQSTALKQIVWFVLILTLTLLASLPLGGILTYYLDMRRGYFPDNWFFILLAKGTSEGLIYGCFFVVISFPYNILFAVSSFFLMKMRQNAKGKNRYTNRKIH